MYYSMREGPNGKPSWKACVDGFAADLMAAADATVADGNLAGAHHGKPAAYAGEFPALVLFRILSRGQAETAEGFMPGEMSAQILVVAPSTNPFDDSGQSGQAYAEELTHQGFAYYIDKLYDLDTIIYNAAEVSVTATALGVEDEFGRVMFRDIRANALAAHSAEVVVRL